MSETSFPSFADFKRRRSETIETADRCADSLMECRIVTAVPESQSGLGLDEIAISSKLAGALGVSDGDSLSVWSGAILYDSQKQVLSVVVDDSVRGAGMSPDSPCRREGDFDGDLLTIVRTSAVTQREPGKDLSGVKVASGASCASWQFGLEQ